MDTDVAVEDGYSFTLWLRTGRLVRRDALGAREVKFNPNHDPKDGRFTFGSGASSAGMSRRSKPVAPQVTGKTWNGGGFTGGGGSAGGGGAAGYYMSNDERQAHQRQHPGRDPYLAQPGDTVASIAAAHGLTADQVRGLNGIAAGARIDPGRVLALPSGALRPALSRVGRDAMAIVGGKPDGVYLYVEAGDGWVGPSLYKDDGTQVRYFDSGETDLVDALFDAWHIEPPDKRWTIMHYTIEHGKFNATFDFGPLRRPDESDDDRRERILHARYGDKPIIYPPMPKDSMEYKSTR